MFCNNVVCVKGKIKSSLEEHLKVNKSVFKLSSKILFTVKVFYT